MTETPEDSGDGLVILPLPPPSTPKRTFRKIKVLASQDDQFYYVAVAKNGETVYTSETFTRRSAAINAARREHEGRSERYDYVLEYENAKGYTVRETL